MKRVPMVLSILLAACGGAPPGELATAGDGIGAPVPDAGAEESAGPPVAGPTGRVTLDPVTCDPPGAIDEAAVDRDFEGLLPQLGECYADVLAQDDGLDGDYTVEVVLAGELGAARCSAYAHVKAGFWIAGFQECLGERLLTAVIGTALEGTATCQLVLHFTKD